MLYDAVVILASADGAAAAHRTPAAKDFVTDAHAHCKFIGYVPSRGTARRRRPRRPDRRRYIHLDTAGVDSFITTCRQIRYWDREPSVDVL